MGNLLLEATQGDGSRVTNRYDGDGVKLFTEDSHDAVYYLMDRGQILAELDPAGAVIASTWRGVDGSPLFSIQRLGVYYYHADRLGSVQVLTKPDGTYDNRYTYDEFGMVKVAKGEAWNSFQYTGAPYSEQAGLLHLGARHYNPAIGRFLSQDTYKGNPWLPWTQNLYVYTGNNPVNLTDPTEHCPGGAYDDGRGECEESGGAAPMPGVNYVKSDGRGFWAGLKSLLSDIVNSFRSAPANEEPAPALEILEPALPMGLTDEQFDSLSSKVRASAGPYGDDIVVQGSRANGTARPDSDIDIAIRVSPERFDDILQQRFGEPNPGSAKERKMMYAWENGIIQRGELGLSGVGRELEAELGIPVDISVIRIGGAFDNGSFIQLRE